VNAQREKCKCSYTFSLILALGGVGNQCHAPAALIPTNKNVTLVKGGWVVPKASLDGCGNSGPAPKFDPNTIHHEAQSLYRLSYCSTCQPRLKNGKSMKEVTHFEFNSFIIV
jgi:hypothetical protein